jgi:hypothetical protein
MKKLLLLMVIIASFQVGISQAQASAFGDINNFDAVNNSGTPYHGFEIELDDIHSTDITYTFDWNHYGTPVITEDNSTGKPRVFVRYAGKRTADGSWTAFTNPESASNPIGPTNGHMCTDPSVNNGCEHFGIGYTVNPSAIQYHWLIANGDTLVQGPALAVGTPVFNYLPPANNGAPAQVEAVIAVPPALDPVHAEFGDAVWVKDIKTTTHNNNEIKLRDLVSKDPEDALRADWTNGEPDEVEVEWRLLQKRANVDGAGDVLAAAPQELNNGDEVITRRYEFYAYTGYFDPENNEALCDTTVGIDDVHGIGIVTGTTLGGEPIDFDCGSQLIVGDYQGAQMAAFDANPGLGMIDHLQDGEKGIAYTPRSMVVGGVLPYVTAVTAGALPAGMSIDSLTGIISGTPTEVGTFTFTVTVTDDASVVLVRAFTLFVAGDAPVFVPDTTTTEVSISQNPATYGDAIVLTMTVADTGALGTIPTGDVEFVVDSGVSTPVSLVDGVAYSAPLILAAGEHTVTARYVGDATHASSEATALTVTVAPATLTVSAHNQTMLYGDLDPTYTFSIAGFVRNEDETVVTTTPSCTAAPHVNPGTYAIVCSGASASNYIIAYTDAVLTVEAPAPVSCSDTDVYVTGITPGRGGINGTLGWIDVNGGLKNGGQSIKFATPAQTTFIAPVTTMLIGEVVSYSGVMDLGGNFCLADRMTFSEGLTAPTVTLVDATEGVSYVSSAIAPTGGVAPYAISASSLPTGLTFNGSVVQGTPAIGSAGTTTITFTFVDGRGKTVTSLATLVVKAAPVVVVPPVANYTVKSEGAGLITAVGVNTITVGKTVIVYNAQTTIKLNDRKTLKIGTRVEWKGLADKVSGNVLASKIETK